MRKHWIEIKARGRSETSEAAALALVGAGSPGVLEEAGPLPERTVVRSSWEEWISPEEPEIPVKAPRFLTLTAYLPGETANSIDALRNLKETLWKIGWTFLASDYVDKDWSVKWKAGIKPARISGKKRSVVIRPSWSEVRARPGDVMVEIDPGMAFGTGGHVTTRMCVKALLKILEEGSRLKPGISFLDVGTGSGVLAIAASLLGADKAVGVDIDPVALKVARKNVRLNGVRVTMSNKPLEEQKGRFSIIAANILGGELIRIAPELIKRLTPGGRLVISGILAEEVRMMTEVFGELGLKRVEKYRANEWAALVFELCRTVKLKH